MKAYESIGPVLRALGVTTLFGLLGDGNIRFALSAGEHGIRYVGSRHEMAAVAMADGYARAAGRDAVGIATVTTGPGVANTLVSLGEAVRAHTPLVLLAGATALELEDYPQLIDQDAMVRAIGVGIQRFRGARFVATDLITAIRRAAAERRPIMFSLPTDAQDEEVGEMPIFAAPVIARPSVASGDGVAHIVQLIADAERPVILAGWGAHLSGAHEVLRRLGEATGAILTTTATAKGFFEDDGASVGTSGGFASEAAADVLGAADLVLAFGAGLNRWTTRGGSLYGDAVIVQVDDDPRAFEYFVRGVVPVTGDARRTASAVLEALGHRDYSPSGFRTSVPAGVRQAARRGDPFEDRSTAASIDPRTLTLHLRDALPSQSTVVTDSGAFMGFPGSYFEPQLSGGFLFPQAFQSVGLGLAHTVGAALARPGTLPVSLIGDGGLMMSLGELETLVRVGEPHLVVVYNDSAYGAEVHVGRHHGFATDLVHFPDIDFARVAQSLGARGAAIHSPQDLAVLDEWLAEPRGVFLLDCKVDVDIAAPFWREFLGNSEDSLDQTKE